MKVLRKFLNTFYFAFWFGCRVLENLFFLSLTNFLECQYIDVTKDGSVAMRGKHKSATALTKERSDCKFFCTAFYIVKHWLPRN